VLRIATRWASLDWRPAPEGSRPVPDTRTMRAPNDSRGHRPHIGARGRRDAGRVPRA
jgi:hypothetical protein